MDEQVLKMLQSIQAQLEAIEARLGGTTDVAASAEQIRQRGLYADLAAKIDFSDVDPVKFADHLMHPDLRLLSTAQRALRAAGGIEASTIYGIAAEDRIAWWGGLIRADGNQGMYATRAQADAWHARVHDDTTIGPG